MSTIITKFSDHVIQPIEYFIDAIEAGFEYRDIKGLTNNKVELISVSKQHPLAVLMASQLQENRNADLLRTGLLPAVSVIPGSQTEEGFTMGQSFSSELIDDTFIDELKPYLNQTEKEIMQEVFITKDQVNLILSEYKRKEILVQINEFRRAEETNISIWSESPDIDNILAQIMDSILADVQVGFFGDNSVIKKMQYRITRGLTNFNFGRVLFGSEYVVNYTNTYKNYTVFSETRISDHEIDFTHTTLEDEE